MVDQDIARAAGIFGARGVKSGGGCGTSKANKDQTFHHHRLWKLPMLGASSFLGSWAHRPRTIGSLGEGVLAPGIRAWTHLTPLSLVS